MTKESSIGAEWAARFTSLLGNPETEAADQAKEGQAKESGATPLPEATEGGERDSARPVQKKPQGPGPALPGTSARRSVFKEVLTPEEMAKADQFTISGGEPGSALMERAGGAVATAVQRRLPVGGRVAVMTGPGNNGGDGFVAARLLAHAGYQIIVGMLAARDRLKGDAAAAAASWTGPAEGLEPGIVEKADMIIDALFGAGLDRPIEGAVAQVIQAVEQSGLPVVAVDLPSGIDGRNGAPLGAAINAVETVTFFRLKPGHLLLPGRVHCGQVTVADIGIDPASLESIAPQTFHNVPGLWSLPSTKIAGHKYDRGHAVVVSGPRARTGAARMAARAALRAGAGLVTVASPPDAVAINASHLTAIMILPMVGPAGLTEILSDKRHNAGVLGPALGVSEETAVLVEAALSSDAAIVVDADGLTSFANSQDRLVAAMSKRSSPTIFTPHDGEFARLFPKLVERQSKLERAREAASQSGAVIVLKGPDTVVAAPDGRAAIADNAPPDLATAGAGDVLSGMIGGLLARGMAGFEAAAAAVWLHGEAGRKKGPGLIAEDLPEMLPAVFADLRAEAENGGSDSA